MPRANKSVAGTVVEFFRTTPLESADLILGLCQDAVRERKAKSSAAKARSLEAVGGAGASAGAGPKAAVPARKKRKARKAKRADAGAATGVADAGEPGLPLVEEYGEGETEDAGDLVNQ